MQLVIALVVTPDGFPLAYEVMNGNTAELNIARFWTKVETAYGKARRVWVMDRGIPSEAVLKEMRAERQTFYLVGTPKGRINQHEKKWLDLPWQKVRDSVEVKLYEHEGELYVLAKSGGRQAKENAMRRKRLARLLRKLRAMRRSLPKRDQLLMRIGAAKKEAGRAFGFVKIQLPGKNEEVTRTFTFHTDKANCKGCRAARRTLSAAQQSHGRRSGGAVDTLRAIDADRECVSIAEKRTRYPAHLSSTRTPRRCACAHRISCLLSAGDAEEPADDSCARSEPTAVLEKLGTIQMIDVWIPTRDGRWLILPRYTQPSQEVQILLDKLRVDLPKQPPPRIKAPAAVAPITALPVATPLQFAD